MTISKVSASAAAPRHLVPATPPRRTREQPAVTLAPLPRTRLDTLNRARDVCLALLALTLLAPVFALIAAAILLDSPGGVFYRQMRTGFNGQRFGMWKFRSMVADADVRKATLAGANQYRNGTLFKMADDPRITRVGKWLRRTSLDELPQLWNILCGSMSFVGPRPTSAPLEQMRADYRYRTLVKPGLTGLWQVSGRSRLSWEESVRLDLRYVTERSLRLDTWILWRTVVCVLKGDGAYLGGWVTA